MKHKVLHFVLLALTFAILVLPAIQQHTQWLEMKPLNGVTVATAQPKLSVKAFMTGEYQRQEEQYLSENIGFREPLTRLYNQMAWSLFRAPQNKTIFVNDDNWIFNDFTIKHYYGQSMYDFMDSNESAIQKMHSDALMIYKLQNILQSYGITFFVCLAPGKDMVCAEHVPEVKGFTRPPGILAIDYYPPMFDSLGINYIDFVNYYEEIKDTAPYPLYLKSSSHWSNQAAVYAADSLFRYMEQLRGINIHDLIIGEEYLDKTHFLDADLEDVMNLLWPIGSGENYYNRLSVDNDTTADKPWLLTVGDSYYKGFMYNLNMDSFFGYHPYWYYNKIVHDDPIHDNVGQVDLLRELLLSDVVMLIYSPCNLFDLNRRFLTQALFSLMYEDGVAEARIEKIVQDIRNTPEWYGKIEKNAVQNGHDVDKELRDNANYMLYRSPELYFDEFKGTTIPNCRNSRIQTIRPHIGNKDYKKYRCQIYSNDEWLNAIRDKAEANGITLERAIDKDIDWMIRNNTN